MPFHFLGPLRLGMLAPAGHDMSTSTIRASRMGQAISLKPHAAKLEGMLPLPQYLQNRSEIV